MVRIIRVGEIPVELRIHTEPAIQHQKTVTKFFFIIIIVAHRSVNTWNSGVGGGDGYIYEYGPRMHF